MRHVSVSLLSFLLAGFLAPLLAQPTSPDKARADFGRVFGGSAGGDSRDLTRARAAWPRLRREIEDEMKKQDRAIREGGSALQQEIDRYRSLASFQQGPKDYYLAGRIMGMADQLEEARTFFEKALAKDRYFYWAHHGLGAYYARRKMHEAAAKAFEQAVRLQGSHLESARGLAFSWLQLERYEQAISMLQQILEVTPTDEEVLRALGGAYALTADYGRGADAFGRLYQLDPRNYDARHMQARCLMKHGRVDEAIRVLERHLLEHPDDWKGHMQYAGHLLEKGDNHDAADAFAQALRVMPAGAEGPDGSPMDKAKLASLIADLRKREKHTVRNPRAKSVEEWNRILAQSQDERLRRQAARVLLTAPSYEKSTMIAFLESLKHEDPVVRTRALVYFERWLGGEQIEMLFGVLRPLARGSEDPRVIGYLAVLMGQSRSPKAVPILMDLIDHRDPYAFQQVHEALNSLTFAYVDAARVKPYETRAEMDAVARQWREWYEKNRDRYRRYETETR